MTPPETDPAQSRQALVGAFAAVLAFSMWGVFPVYFKAVAELSPLEVLAHRVLWSLVLVGILLVLTRRTNDLGAVFGNRKLLGLLTLSALMITLNWLVFIWAVTNDMLLQTSLGYFINPLVSVGLGFLVLKERLRRGQTLAVLIALLAVGNLVIQNGTLPWIALSVAFSFGFYGLIRKIAVVPAFAGLFIETLIVLPPLLAYLIYLDYQGTGSFGRVSLEMDGLLVLAGIMTATPLVLFVMAAKRLRLASLGFFQYLAPTGHFLLAVLVYGESFRTIDAITFAMIWLALAVYSFDSIAAMRNNRQAVSVGKGK